ETDITVELEPSLGKTSFLFSALQNKNIDIYPEFTGTALSQFLNETANSNDKEEVYQQAHDGLLKEYELKMLDPMAYNNTYTLAVSEGFAQQNDVETILDLHTVEAEVQAGFTLEFSDREDGYLGIQDVYGLDFTNVTKMEPQLRYTAMEQGDINLTDAYSTDSEIKRYNLQVLEDDQELFPPYQGAPLIRQETLDQHPALEEILIQLAGKITDDEMRDMNYQVAVEGNSASSVALYFLKEEGLMERDED